jgi:hypothetical protein
MIRQLLDIDIMIAAIDADIFEPAGCMSSPADATLRRHAPLAELKRYAFADSCHAASWRRQLSRQLPERHELAFSWQAFEAAEPPVRWL